MPPVKIRKIGKTRPLRRQRRRSGADDSGGANGWMRHILWLVLLIPIGFGLRMCTKADDDKAVRSEMLDVVRQFPDYPGNSSYYQALVSHNHQQAFENAYTLGGHHQSNSLDAKRYLIDISSLMAAEAERDGKREIAESLRAVQHRLMDSR